MMKKNPYNKENEEKFWGERVIRTDEK